MGPGWTREWDWKRQIMCQYRGCFCEVTAARWHFSSGWAAQWKLQFLLKPCLKRIINPAVLTAVVLGRMFMVCKWDARNEAGRSVQEWDPRKKVLGSSNGMRTQEQNWSLLQGLSSEDITHLTCCKRVGSDASLTPRARVPACVYVCVCERVWL